MHETFTDTLRTLSKSLVALGVGVLALSVYLLQRAADIIVFGLQPSGGIGVDPMSRQPQTLQYGLKFSYLTLSIVWPIVLGVLCTVFIAVSQKRASIVAAISETGQDGAEAILADPFYFTTSTDRQRRLLVSFGWLPSASIICVGAAQLFVALALSNVVTLGRQAAIHPNAWVALNGVLQVIGVSLGLRLVWDFGRNQQLVRAMQPVFGADLASNREPPRAAAS